MHPYVMEQLARQREHELRGSAERYGQLGFRRLRQDRPAPRRAGETRARPAGAALMPVTLQDDEPSWCGHVHPEIGVPADGNRGEKAALMTHQPARVFEAAIARHPQDRHMLEKVFVANLDPDRLAQLRRNRDSAAGESPFGKAS